MQSTKKDIIQEVAAQATLNLEDAINQAVRKSSLMKSMKRKKKDKDEPVFKGKGNQLRYQANEEILEAMQEAADALDQNEVEEAKRMVAEGNN